MNRLLILFCLLVPLPFYAQLVGTITDTKNQPLPFVNIYLENSYIGTTSNEEGNYRLELNEPGEFVVVFQYLGYKTLKRTISPNSFPYALNIQLEEEAVSLEEVVVNTSEDPAYRIIRETIRRRKENLARIGAFTADFYSRGLWRVDSIPKRILGQEVGDFEGALDSTRTGIIYLSETMSEIAYQEPNNFKERILASKVSGNDNGFSFNSAQEANFSFYENTLDLNVAIVSPIANNALGYYEYQLDGVFYEGNKLINKIKVIPKRPNDRIWKGTIYIVEDDWQLYGVELTTNGNSIQVPFIKELVFKQNFTYDSEEKAWVKISQTIDFSFGFLGFNGDGRFIAMYSNYNFHPKFTENSFSNEVLYFEPQANQKDSIYWDENRPVQLTEEENNDYLKKDSIQELRKSKKYLDSIDSIKNKPNLLSPLLGYTYTNSHEKWNLTYNGPLRGVSFNTVQGWNGTSGLSFFKWNDDYRNKWWYASLDAQYGIAEDRLRWKATTTRKFNNTNDFQLTLFGGSEARQFNSDNPILPLVNSISSLYFERNYMKLFELNYAGAAWSQEVFNGLRASLTISYQERNPLFNNTDYVTIPNEEREYTSNNPLAPTDFNSAGIISHTLVKTNASIQITFGQKYMTYPDGKFNLGNSKYPRITLQVENALGANNTDFNFTQLKAQVNQNLKLENFGDLVYNLKSSTFVKGENISFVDFQHFNGNQTRIGTSSRYTNVFNLLPYYAYSTNNSYFEGHAEHHFKGWVLGKVPYLNRLGFHMVLGGHFLSTKNQKPYTELSLGLDNIGWGAFRLLRIDYVHSFMNGQDYGAFIFGLKFLQILD